MTISPAMPRTTKSPQRRTPSLRSAPKGATTDLATPVEQPASSAAAASQNLTAIAYDQLRYDILHGLLRPGEKLGADSLRNRFNIGASPLREALNRLLTEGLVALEEQKGFRVAGISEEELRELVTARRWIDGAAVTECIARRDEAWEERLIVVLHRLSRAVREGTGSSEGQWEERHKAFHMALVGGCGSRWIIRISEQLFDATERYRILASQHVPERDELAEHRRIVDACLAGQADRAVALLSDHYGKTYDIIMSSMGGKG